MSIMLQYRVGIEMYFEVLTQRQTHTPTKRDVNLLTDRD